MGQPVNALEIVILPDGRVRIETGSFAGAAHAQAEGFLAALLGELGVAVEERSNVGHTHAHAHEHAHEHGHGHHHLTAGHGHGHGNNHGNGGR